MFLFRTVFITAFTLLSSLALSAYAAPQFRAWHYVDGELVPYSAPSAGVSDPSQYISEPPAVSPSPVISVSSAVVSPDATSTDLLSESAASASPTFAANIASSQANDAGSLRALGSTGALFGSTVAVLYLVL